MEYAPPILGYVLLLVTLLLVVRLERMGALERNSLIGIRTRKTLSSDEAWRTGHRAAAPYLVAAALTSGLFAAGLAVVVTEDLGARLADVLAVGGYVVVLALVPLGALAANRAIDGGATSRR